MGITVVQLINPVLSACPRATSATLRLEGQPLQPTCARPLAVFLAISTQNSVTSGRNPRNIESSQDKREIASIFEAPAVEPLEISKPPTLTISGLRRPGQYRPHRAPAFDGVGWVRLQYRAVSVPRLLPPPDPANRIPKPRAQAAGSEARRELSP